MNDQMMYEGRIPWQMLHLTTWLERVQPLLYCLLAVAIICLLLALIDTALLCWKEFHPAPLPETIKAAPKNQPAAIRQPVQIVAMLLFAAISALAQDHSLNPAIRDGDLKQVKALLAIGVNLNAQDADGTTPLMYAVVNAEADCVKLLLDKGADPNLSNKAGATALMWAVSDLKKVQLLLDRGANVNAVSQEKNSPLLLALNLPNTLPVVRALLAKGADVNQADAKGNTPLIAAGFNGNLEVVQTLLAKGADPKAKTKRELTYLNAIAFGNNAEAVKWALRQGLDAKDPKAEFLLIGPVMYGQFDVVRLLLAQGADASRADSLGYTPLMYAVLTEAGSLDVVKLLLAHGADAKVKAKDGLTALTFAKRKSWTEAITLLTKAGATE